MPEVLAYHRMVFETPALAARVAAFVASDEEALASALEAAFAPGGGAFGGGAARGGASGGGAVGARPGLTAALRAAQILAVQRVLARENWRALMGGRSAGAHYPDALAAAGSGFAMLQGDDFSG